jgi:hypothetical protein
MSKLDIHRQLWPDTFVTDGSLAVLVAENPRRAWRQRAAADVPANPPSIRLWRKLEAQPVGEILTAFRTPHQIH